MSETCTPEEAVMMHEAGEILFIVRHNGAVFGFRNSGDGHIEPLRGRPAAVPSAIDRAHMSATLSSKGRMRPANKARGHSDPENQVSSASRFLPRGSLRMPRRISATVGEAINKSSSRWAAILSRVAERHGRPLNPDDTNTPI
ncbi:hypothetical protein GCM10017653_15520 [Ancylobacter defluvii]|uniref:Uncharacterized protein n=1 Tax=Ancylobacter defluvii TaxID=1282440 RepID=A0A9W6JY26_9HYPH|nr:hypothetical protein [Ancylobacter defluvii]GLK83483.1 hypothetical protein GCM10017653_15520 [Ancylobacter defluvii]